MPRQEPVVPSASSPSSAQPSAEPSSPRVERPDWLALAAIAAIFGAGWLLVGARANVPVIDDWVYAWSVEHLLNTGQLRVLDISAIYPVSQVLWAAIFAGATGFSFAALRLSTVVLAVAGCFAVYLTLRELGCRRDTSLLGACALALHPVYFALSFSFMTEIPFISFSMLAVWAFLRSINRAGPVLAWLGGFFSVLAFLVRPIGLALPLSVGLALLWRQRDRRTLRRLLFPLTVTAAAMVVFQVGLPRVLGPLDWAAIRWGYLQWWFSIPFSDYLAWNINGLFIAVFPLAPLLLAYASRWRRVVAVGAVAIALLFACRWLVAEVVMPLPDWQTWSLQDIAARAMIGGELVTSAWSRQAVPAVKGLGLLVVAAVLVASSRDWRASLFQSGGGLTIIVLGLLHVALINALWLYNDRYYLVLAPILVVAGARFLDQDPRAKTVAAVLLVGWAVIAISGTRDMLAFNDACAGVARRLEAEGVAPADIDAGYALNGWRLYAHPENLPPGADRRYDVPFVNSAAPRRFSVTNGPLPALAVIRVVPLPSATWQATHAVYLLERR